MIVGKSGHIELDSRELAEFNHDFEKFFERYFDESEIDYELKLNELKIKRESEERKALEARRQHIRFHKSKSQIQTRRMIASFIYEYYDRFGYEDTPAWPHLMLIKHPHFETISLYDWDNILKDLFLMIRTLRQHKSGL